jgi:hypothetical protein
MASKCISLFIIDVTPKIILCKMIGGKIEPELKDIKYSSDKLKDMGISTGLFKLHNGRVFFIEEFDRACIKYNKNFILEIPND